MQTEQQTPVAIVQELLAVHATRKEASEKMGSAVAALKSRTDAAAQQSDAAIAALMSELSQFGDGVGSEATRENPYQNAYKGFLKDGEGAVGESFDKLEAALKETYDAIKNTQTDLPQSLVDLLNKQAAAIGQGV